VTIFPLLLVSAILWQPGVALSSPPEYLEPTAGSWTLTGSLGTARELGSQLATLLPSGKVLVEGGYNSSGFVSSAELYDPAAGTWTATGSLGTARYFHTATLLQSGKVLVVGGFGGVGFAGTYLKSAELYDPALGSWTATGSLVTERAYHTATLLASGKVLVAGGQRGGHRLHSAELYDPTTGTWTSTGNLRTGRYYHTATLLPSGEVLVAGGYGGGGRSSVTRSAELYDPAAGSWTATGRLGTPRSIHTATLLPSGKVLVAGGEAPHTMYLSSAELYDPGTGTWTPTGSLGNARELHTATLLPSNEVLVAGGHNAAFLCLSSAELYDPAAGTWTATGSLGTARYFHTATLLQSGKVLAAAGLCDSTYLSSVELYDQGLGFESNWQPLFTPFSLHSAKW
jgi:Kelch motif/Galactose oxidase, central domain